LGGWFADSERTDLAGGSEVPHGDGGEERSGDSEGMGGPTIPLAADGGRRRRRRRRDERSGGRG
jgi:hypothetical protein